MDNRLEAKIMKWEWKKNKKRLETDLTESNQKMGITISNKHKKHISVNV